MGHIGASNGLYGIISFVFRCIMSLSFGLSTALHGTHCRFYRLMRFVVKLRIT